MNKTNIRRLANAMEQKCLRDRNEKPVGFLMSTWINPELNKKLQRSYPECGTVACIGGYTQIMFAPEMEYITTEGGAAARDALGIDGFDASTLFGMSNQNHHRKEYTYEDVSEGHAIYMLRRMLKTGKIEWQNAIEEYNSGERLSDADIKQYMS